MSSEKIVPALPASSILLVRDGAEGLEVLMVERAKTMRFAPGAFVFPGGKVDAEDSDPVIWETLTNNDAPLDDLAYRVGALRELYEEAAVLLTAGEQGANVSGNIVAALKALGEQLDVDNLVPFAHWVTPETMPRRFDTYFYLARHNGQEAIHDGDEAVSLRWVRPSNLLEDWDKDQVPLMFPTRLNLMKLARANSVDEALEQARSADVVMTMPSVKRTDSGVRVSITDASGYGVTEATEKELRVERPK